VADLLLVRCVEHRVVEGQDVPLHVLATTGGDLGVGDRMFDHLHGAAGGVGARRLGAARRRDNRGGRKRSGCGYRDGAA
jgi:hypothetical protein